MNEKNKNGKTFSDLFSDIDKKENTEKKEANEEINFNKLTEKPKEEVTLDSLFNQITKEDNETNIKKDNNEPTSQISFSSFSKSAEEDNNKSTSSDKLSSLKSSDIFSNINSLTENQNNNLENNTTKPSISSSIFSDTPSNEELTSTNPIEASSSKSNSIFDNNNSTEIDNSPTDFDSLETLNTDKNDKIIKPSIFDEQPIIKKEESPAIKENTSNNNASDTESLKIVDNPFFTPNNKEEQKKEDISFSNASLPIDDFKQNTETEPKESAEENNNDISDNSSFKIEDNPLFSSKEEQFTPVNNPFFNEIDSKQPSPSDDKNSTSSIEEKENTTLPANNVKDNTLETNPFFEESNTNEEETNPFFASSENLDTTNSNPFFDNKLNLVENNSHQNSSNEAIDTSNVQHFNVKVVKKKEPLIKIILGVLSYAIFIWLLLIGITLLWYVIDIKVRAAKGDTSPPKYNAYVVLTGSMLPEIQVYDVVITKKIEPKDLNEGDVITFASSDTRFLNTIITHRIIKKNPPNGTTKNYTFQTKGDNNNVADNALVEPNNIYGKVILKIPKLGYLQDFLATKGGWILVILLPCLAVISYDIVTLSKGIKRKKSKKLIIQK